MLVDIYVEMFDNKGMKTFTQYIATSEAERTPREWAEFFGISRSHFVMIENGSAQPSKALMARIQKKTNGAVGILSWFQEAKQ